MTAADRRNRRMAGWEKAPRPRPTLGSKIRNFGRVTFMCPGCGKDFGRDHRKMNAHHISVHAGRWTSAKARAAARKMGKEADRVRRHAAGWLESAGLRDAYGKGTERSRSRPQSDGRLTLRHMRQLHKHDRDHERAARHDRVAGQARRRDHHWKANKRERAAKALRSQWPVRQPKPVPARPAPARTAPKARGNGHSNGTRPTAMRPAPTGRLAPSRNGRSNGHKPAPARTR